MDISFAGQVTRTHALQAYALHRPPSKVPWVGGIVFVFVLIVTGMVSWSKPALLGTSLPILAFLAILTVVSWWLPRFQVTNSWKHSKTLQKPLSGTITPDRIHFDTAYSESSMAWAAYTYYKRSADMVLLYLSPHQFHLFPKVFFTNDADWETFNKLVEDNVEEKQPTGFEKRQKFLWLGFIILLVLLTIGSFLFGLLGSGNVLETR
jgi:4-amino-4-deoxy-L-arabinose transferase-like glycosyltransferase